MARNACSVSDDGNIFQDLSAFDVPLNAESRKQSPGSKTFDIAFLADVIEALKSDCLTFHKQCKSQYPVVGGSSWKNIITSLDQENRMSLAHVLEQSGVPTLFNTPRLCDPGMLVSKNWSLRNYIETRLIDFKYTYNLGKNVKAKNNQECYPRVVLDFSPFEYKLILPNPKANQSDDVIYVTEWIEVKGGVRKDLGYNPRIALSKSELAINTPRDTKTIFKEMIKETMRMEFGSKITNKRNISQNGTGMNSNQYIESFIEFLKKVDDIRFMEDLGNKGNVQELKLTDDVLAVLYYDMLHDSLFSKNNLPFSVPTTVKDMKGANAAARRTEFRKIPSTFRTGNKTFTFKSKFKDEFKRLTGNVTYNGLVGKTIVQNSIKKYGPWLILKPAQGVIPALFKTLGDLSQYVYAAQYNTVVATGDRMGVGAGLYINAKGNRKVKCMIEDAATGFVIYSGFSTLNFRGRSSCNVRLNNNQACLRTTNVSSKTVANRLREAAPDQELLQKMIRNKPKLPPGLKGLPNQWISSANATNTTTANTIANSIIKFKDYWGEDDANKLINAYSRLKNKISNNSKRAGIKTVINSILPEGSQILDTRGGVSVVSGSPSKKRSRNNAMTVNRTPNNQNQASAMTVNRTPNNQNQANATNANLTPKQNLQAYLNNARFTRLTPTNKNAFLRLLNNNGSNLTKMKKNAVELQRKRELNSYLNTKQLSDRQKNVVRSKISTTSLNNLVRMANKLEKRQRTG
jgi:hypothetical protein